MAMPQFNLGQRWANIGKTVGDIAQMKKSAAERKRAERFQGQQMLQSTLKDVTGYFTGLEKEKTRQSERQEDIDREQTWRDEDIKSQELRYIIEDMRYLKEQQQADIDKRIEEVRYQLQRDREGQRHEKAMAKQNELAELERKRIDLQNQGNKEDVRINDFNMKQAVLENSREVIEDTFNAMENAFKGTFISPESLDSHIDNLHRELEGGEYSEDPEVNSTIIKRLKGLATVLLTGKSLIAADPEVKEEPNFPKINDIVGMLDTVESAAMIKLGITEDPNTGRFTPEDEKRLQEATVAQLETLLEPGSGFDPEIIMAALNLIRVNEQPGDNDIPVDEDSTMTSDEHFDSIDWPTVEETEVQPEPQMSSRMEMSFANQNAQKLNRINVENLSPEDRKEYMEYKEQFNLITDPDNIIWEDGKLIYRLGNKEYSHEFFNKMIEGFIERSNA